MVGHILKSTFTIERPLVKVFDFFADAENLERITPPELRFRILTPTPIQIEKGTLIDYKLRLRGIPIKWRTEITVWEPPFRFVDEQLSGPYRQWIHRHDFTELGESTTLIEDEVRYRLPLEPLGDLALFIVKRELKYIFDYRQRAVAEFFSPSAG